MRGLVGRPDRLQRLIIGASLMILNLAGIVGQGGSWLAWIALGIQVELILTSLIGWCPLYWAWGTTTCRVGDPPSQSTKKGH